MTEAPLSRRILHVDCDAFFVQVARLEDPEGAGRAPLLIVGGSATGRGVVTSASYECRRYGVRSAMPTAHALRLCPDALVVGVPRAACVERSRAVCRTLEGLAPVVQQASIDEFYLDVTGTERLFQESLEETAARIRRVVGERTDISVSVGGASNRLVAKLATSRAKPAGVFVVPPGGEEDFLAELDLADLPGVGPSLLTSLERYGLRTVRDARRVGPEWLVRWLGEGRAHWLEARMRGEDDSPVDPHEDRKSVSTERTFATDLREDERLERELLRLVVSVSGTLRRKELRARTLTVKIRDHDFTTRQRSRTFPEPVESEAALFPVALELLRDLRRQRRTGHRLLGVGLTNLQDRDAPDQLGLFEEAGRSETERDRLVARTVDRVRERFGRESLLPGRLQGRRRVGRRRDESEDEDGDDESPGDDR